MSIGMVISTLLYRTGTKKAEEYIEDVLCGATTGCLVIQHKGALEIQEEERELAFLRYFYQSAGDAFGPASSDVYDMFRQNFEIEQGPLPEGYKREER